ATSTRPSERRRESRAARLAARSTTTHLTTEDTETQRRTDLPPCTTGIRCLYSSVSSVLKQPLLPSQGPERPHIGQAEGEAELVFVSDGAQGEAAVFEAQPAAIPVIAGLESGVLQEALGDIEADIGGGADAALVGVSVSHDPAKLVELRGRRQGARDEDFSRHTQEGMASAYKKFANAQAGNRGAGVDAALARVVIQVPLQIGGPRGNNSQPRDEG